MPAGWLMAWALGKMDEYKATKRKKSHLLEVIVIAIGTVVLGLILVVIACSK